MMGIAQMIVLRVLTLFKSKVDTDVLEECAVPFLRITEYVQVTLK